MSYWGPPEPLFLHCCAVTYGVLKTGVPLQLRWMGAAHGLWQLWRLETSLLDAHCLQTRMKMEAMKPERRLVIKREGSSGFSLNSGLQAPPSCARHLPPNIYIVSKNKIDLEITTKQQPRRYDCLYGTLMLWRWVQVPWACLG